MLLVCYDGYLDLVLFMSSFFPIFFQRCCCFRMPIYISEIKHNCTDPDDFDGRVTNQWRCHHPLCESNSFANKQAATYHVKVFHKSGYTTKKIKGTLSAHDYQVRLGFIVFM